ncbi:MAG: twin-arginine translocase subunit TatC [Euryarchaeota archaeon]|nr:twin-arginine translocase subunit TatC [Euryarchaeota archaeon]
MAFEGLSSLISELRKKLFYIAAVFGAGAIISFSFMGDVIKKIEYDMFFRLNLPGKPDAGGQLLDVSRNLTLLSNDVNNSIIAENLTKLSGELINISLNLNLYKPNIIYITPMEVLMLEFKMSLIFGLLLASPLILYYAYKGAKGRLGKVIPVSKSLIVSTIAASTVLFLIGAGYAYFYMLPFFLSYIYQDAMSLGINANFSVYEFIYFIVMTTVILGLAFELPLISTLLVHLGVTSRQTLARYRKHAYILLLIIAAWVTPDPTMFSQIMVTVPFVVLYEASILLVRFTGK